MAQHGRPTCFSEDDRRRVTAFVGLQTSIITEGFRSLAEGEQVEFFIESGDDGRTKATQVTGPNGAPPQARTQLPRL